MGCFAPLDVQLVQDLAQVSGIDKGVNGAFCPSK